MKSPLRALKRYHRMANATGFSLYEWIRLRRLPRHTPTSTQLFHREFKLVDACTFLHGLDEVFGKRIYDFATDSEQPLIIDAGANVGLSIVFFKKFYSSSRIIAFEPDRSIYDVLQSNVNVFAFSDVELRNQAVWHSGEPVNFQPEGAYSGRIAKHGDNHDLVKVDTFRLRNMLDQHIDFLKMDIEGAEGLVIVDCADLLSNVSNLFLEYHSYSREPQDLHKILSILSSAGFRYHIKEAYSTPHPFRQRELLLGMDLQINIFAFRG
jgi:FkbM family methyltransferase